MRGHYAVGFQSREKGEEGREKCVAGALGCASTEAHCIVTTHFSLLPPLYSLLPSHPMDSVIWKCVGCSHILASSGFIVRTTVEFPVWATSAHKLSPA